MLKMLVKMEVVVVVLEMEKMVKDNNGNEKGCDKREGTRYRGDTYKSSTEYSKDRVSKNENRDCDSYHSSPSSLVLRDSPSFQVSFQLSYSLS